MEHASSLFNGVDAKPSNLHNDSTKLPTCGICGESHESSDCDIVSLKATITDTPVLSKARLSLPAHLKLIAMADGTFSVVTIEHIAKGSRFGPFEAKEQFTLAPTVDMPLKVFKSAADDAYFKEYYLNTTNEYDCNWMYFVCRAASLAEQNLICYQDCGRIYYISVCDIRVGEHLHVGYAPHYARLMKLPSLYDAPEAKDITDQDEPIDVNDLIRRQHKLRDRKTWMCKFCGKVEDNVQKFALHITDHYTAQLRKTCEICKQQFLTLQSLTKHMLLAHHEINNTTMKTPALPPPPKKAAAIPSDQQSILGPMLHLPDATGDSNVLLDYVPNASSGIANETMTLNVEHILNEDENFNFEMAREPDHRDDHRHVCDICLKQFSRLKQLVLHLNAHTGKYICKQCMTVFTRKENLMAHKCISSAASGENACKECGRHFVLAKYLNRHMVVKHGQGFACEKGCKRVFGSRKTLDAHVCDTKTKPAPVAQPSPAPPPPPPAVVVCHLCAKGFGNQRNMRRHLKTHESEKTGPSRAYICEVCSKQFQSKKSLKQHLNSHRQEFKCHLCEKSFTRRAGFLEHMELHKEASPFICTVCNMKFTLKKYLTTHMLLHSDEMKFKCSDCPQRFRLRVNMAKHYKTVHHKTCTDCPKTCATTEEYKEHMLTEHTGKTYQCPVCNCRVKLRSSLKRHVRQKHADDYDMARLDEYFAAENEKEPKRGKAAKGAATKVATSTVTSGNVESPTISSEPPALIGIKTNKEPLATAKINNSMLNDCLQLTSGMQDNMQDLGNNLQLEEIVNVLGGKPSESGDNVLDYGSLEMEFENNFGKLPVPPLHVPATVNITQSFDGSVCLSMPELTDAQGEALNSPFMLDNAPLNGNTVDQVVLYILDQKPPAT